MIRRFYSNHLMRPLRRLACVPVAGLRPFIRRTRFIGITGSCGKTTTKELLALVLRSRLHGLANVGQNNGYHTLLRTILRVRSRHEFCVLEMAVGLVGDMDDLVRLVRPHIGIVLNIGTDHFSSFRGPDGVAAEKGKLVEALPSDGLAILNADDERVIAMAKRTRAKIFTYGLAPSADLRAEEIACSFPSPLAFTAVHGGERVRVTTKLHGAHLVHNILAAFAGGLALGVPLADAARAIANFEPVLSRLSLHRDPTGVSWIQDTWKCSTISIPPALDLMRSARARKKWMIFGTMSDYAGKAGSKYRKLAEDALAISDGVVFVCKLGDSAVKATNPDGKPLRAFSSTKEVRDFLRPLLAADDLVLLKASGADHLERLALDALEPVTCWRERCGRDIDCSTCPLLRAR